MTDAEKLAVLRPMKGKEVVELVKVSWPSPEGDTYYVSTKSPYLLRGLSIDLSLLELRLPGRAFQEVLNDTTIADDKVSLRLWDGDGHLSDLAQANGAGQRVEIFYWFPQIGLLLPMWFGHLQPMKGSSREWYQCNAEVGFLSSMLPMGRRGLYNSCSAMFGGWLSSQEEINENDCPYNRHLTAGSTANPSYQNNANGSVGSNGAFTKSTGGTAWNCGASHNAAMTDGQDAMFEFTIGSAYACAGFTTTAGPVSGNTDFLFGLQWNPDGSVTIKYSGTQLWANAATGTAGDTFRVELRGGRFRAFKGSTEISPGSFVPPAPSYPLYLGIAIQNVGAGISAAHVAIGDIGAGVAVGNLDGGQPFTDCARTRAHCIARLGDDLNYLGFDTVIQSYIVGQTKGPNITVTTRGNESNLKRPLRVVFGQRHVQDLDLLAYTVEPDTRHPEGGAVACLFAICEGPIQGQSGQKVNGVTIGYEHLNVRNGEARQGRTGFSPQVSNYSGTALFFGRAQGDFTKTAADQLRGEVDVQGLRNVRRYTSETRFFEEYSTDRAWCLLRCMTDKRWGYGLDPARLVIQDWIDLASWGQQYVSFTDVDGTLYNSQRTTFNAELIDRTTQQQISDICMAGRYTLPYPDQGKLRIRPLGRALELFSPRAMIEAAYLGCLDRAPSDSEFNSWQSALITARDTSHTALVTQARSLLENLFLGSEYVARGRTDHQFVEDTYRAYFNRDGDAEGIEFWYQNTLNVGRFATLVGQGLSTEFDGRFAGSDIPLFSDSGTARKIIWEDGQPSIRREIVADDELPNRVILTFDDSAHGNAERPLPFEDPFAQLAAGRAFGDTTRRAVEKQYAALGVTDLGEAIRLGNLLLHLGPFDEGGTKNNLRITFKAWFGDCLTLLKYGLIEVDSRQLDRYGFKYFRVRSMRRLPNLEVEISAQAYNEDYYESIESVFVAPPIIAPGADDNPGGDLRHPPGLLPIISADHETDRITFKLSEELM